MTTQQTSDSRVAYVNVIIGGTARGGLRLDDTADAFVRVDVEEELLNDPRQVIANVLRIAAASEEATIPDLMEKAEAIDPAFRDAADVLEGTTANLKTGLS